MMRILDLTTDSLLLPVASDEVQVIHCQTGNAVMHSGCPKQPPRFAALRAVRELARARRYDWIILPPIHLEWTAGNRLPRRVLKGFLRWLMRRRYLVRTIRSLVFGHRAHIAITDYSDEFYPSQFGLDCIAPKHYFMLNVPRDLVGTTVGSCGTRIHYLPTVIPDQLIDALAAQRKDSAGGCDIFVAGEYHNEQRVKQRDATLILATRGRKVFELGEKSFGKFTAGLLDSKLCMAGKGLAYHCFRPLEAAAAGAAPVCHLPERGTYHDYVNGVNCFLYDPSFTPDQIADFVEAILQNPERIESVVAGARRLLDSRHRSSGLAASIFETLKSTE